MDDNQDILISGASVAGPALAWWLSRYGFRPTVVERAPQLRGGGYAVDFRGAAHLSVLAKMGLLDAVNARQTRLSSTTIVDQRGRPVARMPAHVFAGDVEILRGDLAEILYQATQGTTEYLFGDSITSLDEHPGGVDVSFEHAPPRTFGLVIGADGLHSNVRWLAFGEHDRFIEDLACACRSSPCRARSRRAAVQRAGADRGGVRRRGRPGDRAAVLRRAWRQLRPPRRRAAETDRGRGVRGHGLAGAAADGGHGPGARLYFDTVSQVHLGRWSAGRVALLGDATGRPGQARPLRNAGEDVDAGPVQRRCAPTTPPGDEQHILTAANTPENGHQTHSVIHHKDAGAVRDPLQDRSGRNGLVPRARAWDRSLSQIGFGGSRCFRLYADEAETRRLPIGSLPGFQVDAVSMRKRRRPVTSAPGEPSPSAGSGCCPCRSG